MKHALQIAILLNVLQGIALLGQESMIKQLRSNNQQLRNWANLARRVLDEHAENGGTLRVSPDLIFDIEAFVIFTDNEM